MKTSSAKAKGRRFQQWVAEKISDLLGIQCGKDQLIESRESSQSGVDVKLIGEAAERFKFSIECKNQEKFSIPVWIEQAKSNQKGGTDWLLFVTKNRYDKIVIMDAEAFFKLYERSIKNESNRIR